MVKKAIKQAYARRRREKAATYMRTGLGARRARRRAREGMSRKTQRKVQRKY